MRSKHWCIESPNRGGAPLRRVTVTKDGVLGFINEQFNQMQGKNNVKIITLYSFF